MPAKKKYKVSEDGVLRDATDEEAANIEQLIADNTLTSESE